MSNQEAFFVPDNIQPLLHPNGAILMDISEGRYKALDQTGRSLLQVVNDTGSRSAIHAFYIEQIPQIPNNEVIEAVDRGLGMLASGGVVATGEVRPPRQFKVVDPRQRSKVYHELDADVPSLSGEKLQLTLGERVLALRSLSRVTGFKRQPFSHWTAKLERIKDAAPAEASHEEALHFKSVVHEASRWSPRRVACFESTLATVLFGCARGVKIGMQFGVALDPIRFHVWPEAGEQAVRLPHEEITDLFTPIYKI